MQNVFVLWAVVAKPVCCIIWQNAIKNKGKAYYSQRQQKCICQKNMLCCHVMLPCCVALEIKQKLEQWGFVVAGVACGDGKMAGLPKHIWETAFPMADIVLVEADGAKRLPLKLPNDTEPVIPKACDFLVTVVGLSCLGKKLSMVCHRWQRAGVLGYDANTIVMEKEMANILQMGYQTSWKQYNGCVFANQADCVTKEQARRLRNCLQVPYVWGSLQKEICGKENKI